MGFTCAVADCKNSRKEKHTRGSELVFHRFPKNKKLCAVWTTKCRRRNYFNPSHSYICSDHFVQCDYERDLKSELLSLSAKKRLKASAIPSVFKERRQPNLLAESGRTNRAQRREATKVVNDILQANCSVELTSNSHGQESMRGIIPQLDKENLDPIIAADDHDDFNHGEKDELRLEDPELYQSTSPSKSLCFDCMGFRSKILELENQLNTATYVIECHKREILRLEETLQKVQGRRDMGSISSKYLPPSQLKKMQHKSRVNWTTDDIVKALSVRSISLKAYETIRNVFKLPLPASRTLSSWSQKFTCEEGNLSEVIAVLGKAVSTMDSISSLAVLSFDELSLDSTAVIDATFGNISSHSKAQVMFVRGLCAPWKQPIYYKFDQNVTKMILFDIIKAVELAGIKICATVCDLGPTNLKLFGELGINLDCTSFPNPADPSREVFVFADVPHCLKNLRNHVLDNGAILPHGHTVDKSTLFQMLENNGTELKLVKNFDASTIDISGPQRMRVRKAAQFFSHSMASLAWKSFPAQPEIGNFFEIINNGFDALNSRVPHDKKNRLRSGFGLFYEDQVEALVTLQDTVSKLRFRTPKGNKRNSLLPCQRGFLISIKSLMTLHCKLKSQYNVSYILTCRLNQDSLESLFGRIRAFGGPNSHPTAVEFRYRLKLVLLGGSTKPIRGSNVNEDYGTEYLSKNLLELSSKTNTQEPEDNDFDEVPQTKSKPKQFNEVEGNSLLYLAGYLCWKLGRRGRHSLGIRTRDCNLDGDFYEKTWLGILSKGGLYIPDDHVLDAVRLCEVEFRNSFEYFCKSKYCDKKLFHYIRRCHPTIDPDILREFIKVRIRIRVKYINQCKQVKKKAKERKLKQFIKSKK